MYFYLFGALGYFSQKRIAEILDRAESLRAMRRQSIEQLNTLTQAIFLEMFGDPVTNPKGWKRLAFGELLANIDSGWSPVCLDRSVEGEEWGVLKLGAVTKCEYKPSENKALPPDVQPNLKIEVKQGDLLFTRKNTYELIAACALVKETPPRLLMSDLIFRFRLREDSPVNSSFLHQLLIYPTKRRAIQKLAGGSSSSMPNISKTKLQDTLVEAPPIDLQQKFAQRVEAIEKLKATHQKSLTELDALFASLQHRAFRGEL
jgi:type I restriction enzyme, S subunit